LQDIVQKEAVYCAIGRCAYRLRDRLDLSLWIEIAKDEAKNPSEEYVHNGQRSMEMLSDHHLNSYLIIQRRIVWLIGRWVSQDCYPPSDPRIWQILLHLLTAKGAATDLVMLTTATALQQCVDVSFRADKSHISTIIYKSQATLFNLNIFAPFLAPTVAELLKLIDEVDAIETKNKLAGCLNTILDRARAEVFPSYRFMHSASIKRCADCSVGLFDYLYFSATM